MKVINWNSHIDKDSCSKGGLVSVVYVIQKKIKEVIEYLNSQKPIT